MIAALSMGVEEEYLVADAVTRQPLAAGAAIVEQLSDVDFHREFAATQAEFATPVCSDLASLHRELDRGRTALAGAARGHGALLVASGTPPLGRAGPPPVTAKPRYQNMAAVYGALAEDQGVCGCHVHIGVPDADHAIRASNHVRLWLPALLVLGANSPFFDGRDTGHASWRTAIWSRWPVCGVPPRFHGAAAYDDLVARLISAEVITDPGMVYFYVRPSRHAPTVEVRVADVAATVEEALLQAALTRALVSTALVITPRDGPPDVVLRIACARAAAAGLDGRCLDAASGRPCTGWELVEDLVAHVRPALRDVGDLAFVEHCLAWLRKSGGGAARQRQVLGETGDLRAVVDRFSVPVPGSG
ncbi:carboxylate-amine ligase [Lentzea flava]|uniref:Putative glutamate--cysteine ligase 2 n=1 Tax=Lentzea flava TaxID=103732 RepID=A0ABQ2URA0_9PSEU|nr:glutamate--cysteine ligase [Lentzea flava]MCP2197306.1 carboxylate-amine ligase [Lentzea flava]GGU50061.1 putative glutamate--cysteine ligase 2-3 [Lentzea flava]